MLSTVEAEATDLFTITNLVAGRWRYRESAFFGWMETQLLDGGRPPITKLK